MRVQEGWKEETKRLRAIALGCGLKEEMKWGKPCFTLDGKNVVLIQGFKESCALLFFKGSLLKDAGKILKAPGEDSQSSRWVKFTSWGEIDEMEGLLKAYIDEAIQLEKSGAKVKLKKIEERALPPELETRFRKDAALKKAFRGLTPGRQRQYLLFFSGAKQVQTREARIEKWIPAILKGKGMMD